MTGQLQLFHFIAGERRLQSLRWQVHSDKFRRLPIQATDSAGEVIATRRWDEWHVEVAAQEASQHIRAAEAVLRELDERAELLRREFIKACQAVESQRAFINRLRSEHTKQQQAHLRKQKESKRAS